MRPDYENVTAIIQHYYPERAEHLGQILTSYQQSTVLPDRVIIWDNARTGGSFVWHGHETMISSHENTLLGRYAAVLLAPTDYVMIQDDDLVLGPNAIKTLFEAAIEHSAIVGPMGIVFGPSSCPYLSRITPREGPVSMVLGRCLLAHRRAFIAMFKYLLNGGRPPGRADDILLCTSSSCRSVVVPVEYTNLEEYGVGLSYEAGHYEERDLMVRFYSNDLSVRWYER